MRIWTEWWSWVEPLRAACSRSRSFLWLLAALAGISIRSDLLGVTSIVRALGLGGHCYDRLLDFFHSKAVDPDALCQCWVKTVFARMPGIHRVNGRPVLLGDGIKIPKRGRKMPAVKLLHQVSESNTKPEYILGPFHSGRLGPGVGGIHIFRGASVRAHSRRARVQQP